MVIPYQPSAMNINTAGETSKTSEEEADHRTEDHEERRETKKKNPYSIEELLKKPDKRTRSREVIRCVEIQQPYGVLVESEFNERKTVYDNVSPVPVDRDNSYN